MTKALSANTSILSMVKYPHFQIFKLVNVRISIVRQNNNALVWAIQFLDEHNKHEGSWMSEDNILKDSIKAAHNLSDTFKSLNLIPLNTNDQSGPSNAITENFKPKQIAVRIEDGNFVPVARTYDVTNSKKGDFAVKFELSNNVTSKPLPEKPLYRTNYQALIDMVQSRYHDVQWIEASQYDIWQLHKVYAFVSKRDCKPLL